MTTEFEVRYTETANEDLLRLFDFLLVRATTVEDFDSAQIAIDAIREAVENNLSRSPFIFRKVAQSPFLRELIIPFRGSGFVAMFEIEGNNTVNLLAVRHQLEEDYH